MTDSKKTRAGRPRRKPARKTQTLRRAKHPRSQSQRRKRNVPRARSRWLRAAGAGAIFAAAASLGVLVSEPILELAARLDPASQTVDEIAVLGLHRLDARVIVSASGVERGAPRSQIDPDAVAARISEHPWVRSATVLEGPVGPLVVRIEERSPQAVLRVEGSHRWRLIDDTGTPFAAAREADLRDLPHVSSTAELPMNAPNALLAQAVQIGREARRSGLMAISGSGKQSWIPELRLPDENGEGWTIAAHGRSIEAVLGFGNLEAKLVRLARMLRAAPETLAKVGRVDLRFGDHAVMRMEDSKSRD